MMGTYVAGCIVLALMLGISLSIVGPGLWLGVRHLAPLWRAVWDRLCWAAVALVALFPRPPRTPSTPEAAR